MFCNYFWIIIDYCMSVRFSTFILKLDELRNLSRLTFWTYGWPLDWKLSPRLMVYSSFVGELLQIGNSWDIEEIWPQKTRKWEINWDSNYRYEEHLPPQQCRILHKQRTVGYCCILLACSGFLAWIGCVWLDWLFMPGACLPICLFACLPVCLFACLPIVF